jgi:hypothetical protein
MAAIGAELPLVRGQRDGPCCPFPVFPQFRSEGRRRVGSCLFSRSRDDAEAACLYRHFAALLNFRDGWGDR